MESKVKFSENVIIVDAGFLQATVSGLRTFFENNLGRALPLLDLPSWLSYVALDAGLREGDNEIQVLLVHDEATRNLSCCTPSVLADFDGKACRTPLGEFVFANVTSAGLAKTSDLFVDLLHLAIDSNDVKRMVLVPTMGEAVHVQHVLNELDGEKGADVLGKAWLFSMEKPT